MNERTTFPMAVAVAELSASVLTYFYSPTGPLCAGFANLLSYAGQHGSLAVLLWLLAFGAAWLIGGKPLVRPRQNLSTKLRLLTWIGLTGIVIDNAVSLYQFESPGAAGPSSSIPLTALAGRTLVYVIAFAAVVALSWLISSRQKPTVTPPPRFGRE